LSEDAGGSDIEETMVGRLEVIDVDFWSNRRVYSVGCLISAQSSRLGGVHSKILTVFESCYPNKNESHINENMSKKTE
jgi:hypothetical protein